MHDSTGLRPTVSVRGTMDAVRRIAAVEIWERFSFYTMNLLLPLFLMAPKTGGGFGWSASASLRFYGAYIGIAQFLPVLGGYVGDRWLGERRALRLGAWCMLVGHLLLSGPHVIPLLAARFSGLPVDTILGAGGVEFGRLFVPVTVPAVSAAAYEGVSMSFYAALALVAIGNGFFKPALPAMLGRLPHASVAARDAAYLTLFQYVHIGAIAASLGSGWLAQTYGWQWAFAAAAAGMTIAITLIGRLPAGDFFGSTRTHESVQQHTEKILSARVAPSASIAAVSTLLVLAVLFFVGDYQVAGLVDVFAQQHTNRMFLGLQIPATWFVALNPVLIVTLAPLLSRLALRHPVWGHAAAGRKIAGGFLLTALAFLLLWAAYRQAHSGALAHPLWILGCVASLTLGELLVSPIGSAAISRFAPANLLAFLLGIWFAANGLGGWLSGELGAAVVEGGEHVLLMTAGSAAAVAILLWTARGPLRRIGL